MRKASVLLRIKRRWIVPVVSSSTMFCATVIASNLSEGPLEIKLRWGLCCVGTALVAVRRRLPRVLAANHMQRLPCPAHVEAACQHDVDPVGIVHMGSALALAERQRQCAVLGEQQLRRAKIVVAGAALLPHRGRGVAVRLVVRVAAVARRVHAGAVQLGGGQRGCRDRRGSGCCCGRRAQQHEQHRGWLAGPLVPRPPRLGRPGGSAETAYRYPGTCQPSTALPVLPAPAHSQGPAAAVSQRPDRTGHARQKTQIQQFEIQFGNNAVTCSLILALLGRAWVWPER